MLTRESIKQFLKPDWRKILLSFLAYLPLVFANNCAFEPWLCGQPDYFERLIIYFPLFLLLYLVFCLIFFIYDRKIKYFFRPNKKKIFLFVLLFFFFLTFFGDPYRSIKGAPCGGDRRWGYPFIFLNVITQKNIISEKYPPVIFCGTKINSYNYYNLFLDLIFWYLLSCLLISAWDKIKSKKSIV